MPDKEKVIKGLEVCTSIADGESCPKDCPYYQEVCYGYDQLMRDALAMLKEQEKQKFFVDESGKVTPLPVVVRQETTSTGKTRLFQCEKCGYGIDDIFLSNEYDYDVYPKYCPNCGRQVKWE